MVYPSLSLFPRQRKRRKKAPKSVKESVWLKYNKNRMTGKCYVCGRTVHYMSFELGHNKAHAGGGKWNINNLRPICRTCNRSMGTMSIETYKKKYFSKPKKRKKTTRKKRKRRPRSIWGMKYRDFI